jgi:nicotinamidase-related amidase
MNKRAVLLVVDVQRGFIMPDTKHVPAAIKRHIMATHDQYEITIATKFTNPPGSLFETRLKWIKMRDPVDTALCDEVASFVNVIIRKTGYGSLTPQVIDILESLKIETVDVCGVDTDQCVLATLFELWDMGFAPRLLVPQSGSTGGPEAHAAGILSARRAIGIKNVVG